MDVRVAPPADAADIADVHVEAWKTAYRSLVPDAFLDGLSVSDRATRWSEILDPPRQDSSPTATTLVGVRGGELVGFCSVGPARDPTHPPRTGEVWALYTHPKVWGTHTGWELLERGCAELGDTGHRTACLWVLEGNHRAIRFYRRAGWATSGATKLEALGDTELAHLEMERTL